jgi:hypothetical protein
MPKYTFACESCGKILQKYASIDTSDISCECGQGMQRKMPSISGMKSTEVVDKLLNKKHFIDQDNSMKERKLQYYWEIEVPKMVNSGTYSLETMIEQGWVYYNEKQELVTRTAPPQKT